MSAETAVRRGHGWVIWPLACFAALAAVFAYMLFASEPQRLPSALIGKPLPGIQLEPISGLRADDGSGVPAFSDADLKRGEVSIINVWASWCAPCHAEHPFLTALGEQSGAPLYGINYKDEASKARRFLGRYGNPFVAVGQDPKGRAAIDLGVYGVPETYIIDGGGKIVYRHVGPLTGPDVSGLLVPLIERLRQGDG